MVLDAATAEHFIHNGFVHLPNAMSRSWVKRWTVDGIERLNRALERHHATPDAYRAYDLDDPTTWPPEPVTVVADDAWNIARVAPTVWKTMVALCGGATRIASPTWPNELRLDHRVHATSVPRGQRVPAKHFHLDDPDPLGELVGYRLGLVAIVLLSDVALGDGATVFAPESLGAIARALAQSSAPRNLDNLQDLLQTTTCFEHRVEAVGAAGDVYLLHGLVAHTGGPRVLRHDGAQAWVRRIANPATHLVEGLRFGTDEGMSPLEQAVYRTLDGSQQRQVRAQTLQRWPSPRQTSTRPTPETTPARVRKHPNAPHWTLPLPAALERILRTEHLGRARRLTHASGTLRLTVRQSDSGSDFEFLIAPTKHGAAAVTWPYTDAQLSIGYAGGDGGTSAVERCRQLGQALAQDGSRSALLELMRQPPEDDTRGRLTTRVLGAPEWLCKATEDLGSILQVTGNPEGLTLLLEHAPHATPARVSVTELPTTQAATVVVGHLALTYRGPAHDGTTLCERLGQRLLASYTALQELMTRAADGPVSKGVSDAFQAVKDGRPDDARRQLEAWLSQTDTTAACDDDIMAGVAISVDEPWRIWALEPPGPSTFTGLFQDWLSGEQGAVDDALEQIAAHCGDHAESLYRLGQLARALGRTELAARLYYKRADALEGSGRWLSLLDVADMGHDIGAPLLAQAEQALSDSGPHLARVARAGLLSGHPAIAERAYARAMRRSPGPRTTLGLAEMQVWRGDTRAARETVAHVPIGPEDADADARRRLVEGACDILDGDYEQGLVTLAAVDDAPDIQNTLYAWRCEAHLRLGRLDEAGRAINEAQKARHNLATSTLTALVRARQESRSGSGSTPWTMLSHDPDGVVTGRLDGTDLVRDTLSRPTTVADGAHLLEQILQRLGGNRTHYPYALNPAGEWTHHKIPRSPRQQSAHFIYQIDRRGFDDALRGIQGVRHHWASSPHPSCYEGELLLWMGRYDAAVACFEESIRRGGTRWAYIGLGAAAAMVGAEAEALRHFQQSVTRFGDLRGATLTVYRGELHRRAGRLDDATADLEEAVTIRPGRLGAWVNLALIALEHGDAETARRHIGHVGRRAPFLLRAAAEDLGLEPLNPAGPISASTWGPVLENALTLSLGNRSSTTWTLRRGDSFKVLPRLEPLRTWTRQWGDFSALIDARGTS